MTWSVVAAIASIVAVIVTIVYGEVERRLARRQLELAEEQATQRPSLEVSVLRRQFQYQWPIPIPNGYMRDGHLLFEIKNTGRTAAHNIECRFEFDTEHLEPLGSSSFGFARLAPFYPQIMQVNARPHTHGLSRVSYRCAYDEGEPVTDTIEFEIPEPEGEDLA